MKKKAICFTKNGEEIIKKINVESKKRGIDPVEAYVLRNGAESVKDFTAVECSLEEWTRQMFLSENAIIFVGATGIAVRAIAGLPEDKCKDCPVTVIDDNGRFVIPLLSGHAGGANKIAAVLAGLLDAVPVITTSTDINDAFSVDTYAVERRLSIANRDGIKKVSVKALEEKKISLSIKDFPPKEAVDVVIADETDAEYSLLLRPKRYTVGIGMKKGKDAVEAERFFLDTLEENGIGFDDVYALCTIDIKEDEPAIIFLRDKYRIPLVSFDSEILKKVQGSFESSEFVFSITGVDNVCERAAVAGAGAGAELIQKKKASDGMTIAVAKMKSIYRGVI